DLALGWAHRLVGLRDGEIVLDRPAAGLAREDIMPIYQRIAPEEDTRSAAKR
ncbi:MAG: phosphonate ABC transporter ATP-binding protein, partial [Rhodococcus fascians]